jgi:predicted RNA-binding Zn-ribbon protein involved in translation (DUF1610 family)
MAEAHRVWKCPKCGRLVREQPIVAWRRHLYEEDPRLGYISFAKCPHCGATIEIEARTFKDERK